MLVYGIVCYYTAWCISMLWFVNIGDGVLANGMGVSIRDMVLGYGMGC